MSRNKTEIYYLSELEFYILLAGKGVKKIYGLKIQDKNYKREDVCLAMNHLYQTKLIESSGQEFVIAPALEALILGIADAKIGFLIRSSKTESENLCCFELKEGYVFVKVSKTDTDSYEIGFMGAEQIKEHMDTLVIAENKYELVLDEELMYEEICQSRKSVSNEKIFRYRNLSLYIEKIDLETASVEKKLLIQKKEDMQKIDTIYKNRQEIKDAPFEQPLYEKQVEWMLEKEK